MYVYKKYTEIVFYHWDARLNWNTRKTTDLVEKVKNETQLTKFRSIGIPGFKCLFNGFI